MLKLFGLPPMMSMDQKGLRVFFGYGACHFDRPMLCHNANGNLCKPDGDHYDSSLLWLTH